MPNRTTYTIKPLDETTWDAFAGLVERNNGVFGGCWCIGFHPEGADRTTAAALNRRRKLARVREGKAHAARDAGAGAWRPPRWPVRWT
jgi:hypothetical protein